MRLKGELQMDVQRCNTPDLVEKEFWMHVLAYNLIRGVIAAAAQEQERSPRQLNFKGALQALESFREELGFAKAPELRAQIVSAALRVIAANIVGG
jgi:hypothetical protein